MYTYKTFSCQSFGLVVGCVAHHTPPPPPPTPNMTLELRKIFLSNFGVVVVGGGSGTSYHFPLPSKNPNMILQLRKSLGTSYTPTTTPNPKHDFRTENFSCQNLGWWYGGLAHHTTLPPPPRIVCYSMHNISYVLILLLYVMYLCVNPPTPSNFVLRCHAVNYFFGRPSFI